MIYGTDIGPPCPDAFCARARRNMPGMYRYTTTTGHRAVQARCCACHAMSVFALAAPATDALPIADIRARHQAVLDVERATR